MWCGRRNSTKRHKRESDNFAMEADQEQEEGFKREVSHM
jgi:hypothetical protein